MKTLLSGSPAPAPATPVPTSPQISGDEVLCPLKPLLEALPQAACVVDEQLLVRFWNAEMVRFVGVARSEALARPLFTLVPRDFRHGLETALLQLLTGRTAGAGAGMPAQTRSGEIHQHHRGDTFLLFQYHLALLPAIGERRLALLSLRSAPRSRKSQEQLDCHEQLDLFGKLTASVAHELAGALDLICHKLDDILITALRSGDQSLAQDLQDIIPQVYRLSYLTNNIVTLGRDLAPARVTLQLNDMILECIALLEQTLKRKIPWVIALPPDLPTVTGDPILLQIVLLNLVKYAIDAAGEDVVPKVQTAATEDGRSVVVHLEDRGPVLDDHLLANFFDPAHTTERLGLAAGLGLYLSRKIVEAHHGTLEVRTREGHGTELILTLPATA